MRKVLTKRTRNRTTRSPAVPLEGVKTKGLLASKVSSPPPAKARSSVKQLPSIHELLAMSRWAIKRLRLTPEELQSFPPNARVIIAVKTRAEGRQLILRRNGSLSVRVRGRHWEHHGWEISKKDFRLLLPEEKKRIEHRQIRIVEEYGEGTGSLDLREWEERATKVKAQGSGVLCAFH